MKYISFFLILFISYSGFGNTVLPNSEINHWETVVYANNTWSYFEGTTAPPNNWHTLQFNDSNWKTGKGGFGYADGDDQTIVQQANSLFIRNTFEIKLLSNIVKMLFHIDYDDGFVAYLNGVEIARSYLTDEFPGFQTLTNDQHEAQMYNGGLPAEFEIDESIWQSLLIEGKNVLAIQIHNSSNNSSDMSAIPFLTLGISDESQRYGIPPLWFKEPFNFSSSNLPIIIIETENQAEIRDEPKVTANMKIIDNPSGQINLITDPPTDYDGFVGIEIRGAYSSGLPQKPYGIETRDSLGENNNVKLLDMPKENDWILLANYNDKSFMRNTLAFHLFEKMGHYAPRTRICEVVVNNDYQGVYIFTERIKIDKNRVDIAKLDEDDNAGDSITGGYIFKIDYPDQYSWKSNFSPLDRPGGTVEFVNHDPEGDEITDDQQNYLMWYIDQFETSLYSSNFEDELKGYRAFIDADTFIDYFIISELSRNVDAYKKSRYFYKNKDSKSGLLCSGPVWDYDWAWKNINDCSFLRGQDGSGWAYKINECSVWPTPPSWIVRFLQDPLFVDQLYSRYTDLRKTILSESYIKNYADSIQNLLAEAQVRHYNRWPILGRNVGAPENDNIPSTFEGEIEKLFNWIDTRLSWLDQNITGNYISSIEELISPQIKIYPNPANQYVFIESVKSINNIEIYNLSGALIKKNSAFEKKRLQISTSNFKNGVYFLRIKMVNGYRETKQLIINN